MDLLEDAKTDRVYLPAGNEYDAEYNNGVPLDEEIQK